MLLFTQNSPYRKQARFVAVLWTLLILLGCFMPANKVPKVDVPLMDKWVHFALFGGFTFLWLCVNPTTRLIRLLLMLAIAFAFGTIIEVLQGMLTFLGRASEAMDVLADGIGGLLGVLLFMVGTRYSNKASS